MGFRRNPFRAVKHVVGLGKGAGTWWNEGRVLDPPRSAEIRRDPPRSAEILQLDPLSRRRAPAISAAKKIVFRWFFANLIEVLYIYT